MALIVVLWIATALVFVWVFGSVAQEMDR